MFSPGTPAVDHNLFHGNAIDLGGAAVCIPNCWFGQDPLIVNIPGHDFHIDPASPAIDQGSMSLAPPNDFDFEPRPQGPMVDIGADEVSAGPPPGDRVYTIEQGGVVIPVSPLVGTQNVVDYYSYGPPGDPASANTVPPIEASQTSRLFLYRDPAGELSLVMIHDEPDDLIGGQVTFNFAGVPAGTDFVVRDDASLLEATLPSSQWGWGACCTDGGALSGTLNGPFEITIDPQFIGGIDRWEWLDGPLASPTVRTLDMTQPITIRCRPAGPPPPVEGTVNVRLVNADDPTQDLSVDPLVPQEVGDTARIDLVVDLGQGPGPHDNIYAAQFSLDAHDLQGVVGRVDPWPGVPGTQFQLKGPGLALDPLEELMLGTIGFPEDGALLRDCNGDTTPEPGDDSKYEFIKGVTDGSGVELQNLDQHQRT